MIQLRGLTEREHQEHAVLSIKDSQQPTFRQLDVVGALATFVTWYIWSSCRRNQVPIQHPIFKIAIP